MTRASEVPVYFDILLGRELGLVALKNGRLGVFCATLLLGDRLMFGLTRLKDRSADPLELNVQGCHRRTHFLVPRPDITDLEHHFKLQPKLSTILA